MPRATAVAQPARKLTLVHGAAPVDPPASPAHLTAMPASLAPRAAHADERALALVQARLPATLVRGAVGVHAPALPIAQRRDEAALVHVAAPRRKSTMPAQSVLHPQACKHVTTRTQPLYALAAAHIVAPLALVLVERIGGGRRVQLAVPVPLTMQPCALVHLGLELIRVRALPVRHVLSPRAEITVAIRHLRLAVAASHEACCAASPQ